MRCHRLGGGIPSLSWGGTALTICALATLCGARGTRAISDFAGHLNQTTTPAFNRFCMAHRRQAIHWLISSRALR
ncbi:MAG: hypothetical protein HY360_12640 [Verrucomicrobia bacterium]|nr:hypothetical protein [Verrucomicrobiota bacterium]